MRNSRQLSTLPKLLAAAAAVLTCILLYWGNRMNKETDLTLRVALNTSILLEDIDTAKIKQASDYSLLELLYSTLVEYNNEGEIIGGLAERFFWDNDNLVFEFRDTASSSGHRITPEDAIATFKRLMILNTNSHGDLVSLLCMDKRPMNLTDACEGMEASGKRLILKTKKKTPFLLPLLTTLDYGIIPQNSLDKATLHIIHHTETSGPYKISDAKDKLVLEANKKHWHYKPRMPQRVELYPFDYNADSPNSAESQFINGNIDFIPTASELRLGDIEKISSGSRGKFTVQTTNPMYLAYAEYTERGLSLSSEKRRHLLASFQRAVRKTLSNDSHGRVSTIQILPPSSEGNLSLSQTQTIEENLRKYSEPCDATGIKIAIPESVLNFYRSALESEIKNLTFVGVEEIARFENRNDDDVPDLTISAVDVTAIEDINFISYSVKNGILVPPEGQTPAEWLKIYFETPEKSARMSMLQKIQFHTIWENPKIIPISIRPFVSVIDSRWKTDFSKLFPNDPFWKIEHE